MIEHSEYEKLELEKRKLKEERDNCLKEVKLCYNDIHSLEWQISDLEEENIKLKLHIEAKDKAYTVLLKDYEEIKEDRDKMKAEIEQRLNAFRNR